MKEVSRPAALTLGCLACVVIAAVGVVVLRRQGNLIGWLSLAFAVLFLLSIDAGFYLVARYRLGQDLPLAPVMLFAQPLCDLVRGTRSSSRTSGSAGQVSVSGPWSPGR